MTRNQLTERVNFDIIRYANCWEDPDVLLSGLSPSPGSRILSIGSAGDNSFSLLTTDPEIVVAVDVSMVQLFLVELKKCCFQNLEWEETLAFLGFTPSETREKSFRLLKHQLGSEARAYWESNLALVRQGVIHQGKFEKYFQLFSRKILPFIHSKKLVEVLLAPKTAGEQQDFYSRKWNTWRWRLLFRVFFSNYVMGKYGRDPEFTKHVQGSVSQYIFEKAARHLRSAAAQDNFILRYTLTGNFGALLPHYLQKENYPVIRSETGRLHLVQGFAQDTTRQFGKFHCMNLSNIFEYMDTEMFTRVAAQLAEGLQQGGKLAYWNLMVPRRISEVIPDVQYCRAVSERLTENDRGFFYKEFILDQA